MREREEKRKDAIQSTLGLSPHYIYCLSPPPPPFYERASFPVCINQIPLFYFNTEFPFFDPNLSVGKPIFPKRGVPPPTHFGDLCNGRVKNCTLERGYVYNQKFFNPALPLTWPQIFDESFGNQSPMAMSMEYILDL